VVAITTNATKKVMRTICRALTPSFGRIEPARPVLIRLTGCLRETNRFSAAVVEATS
jgi:hypothetical protein